MSDSRYHDLLRRSKEELAHELVAAEEARAFREAAAARGRRRTDPPGDDHMRDRRGDNGAIDVGYKGAHVAVRGPMAIIAVLVALLGVGLIYVNRQGFAETNSLLRQAIADHRELASSQDLLSCVVSLSMEERATVRRQGTREAFRVVCPWLRPEATR